MVLLTHPERPMVRTHKGTVTKKSTLTLYEQEIEELYVSGFQPQCFRIESAKSQTEHTLGTLRSTPVM
jgi:hypothetical protein